MGLLFSIFATAIASALIPVVNIEAVLLVTHSQTTVGILPLTLAAASGQMIGKSLWFWGGTHLDRAAWVRRYLEKPKAEARLTKWRTKTEGRPGYMFVMLFISAWVGFPPYAVMSVLAGVLKVRWWLFLTTGMAGRTLRFWTILGGFELIRGWF